MALRIHNWFRKSQQRLPRRVVPQLEVLEDRLAPAISSPTWTAIGPAPEFSSTAVRGIGNSTNPTNPNNPANPVSGAVQVLRLVPNSTIAYAGTVNGGVWDTLNYTAASPTWVALTDGQASLSIRDIALSQVPDGNGRTGLTIYAATGNSSSLSTFGAGGAGIYKITIDPTTGAATNVTTLGGQTFGTAQIGNLLVTGTAMVNNQLQDQLGAGTLGGAIYTSTNGGQSWTLSRAGQAGTMVTDLVQVPTAPVQQVTLSGNGTSVFTFEGQTTTTNFNIGGDSGSTLQADLQDLSTIGAGNVVVTPTGVSRTFIISFQGALAGQTVPPLTASASAGSGATVTPVTGANAVQTVTLSGNGTSVFTFKGQTTTTNFNIGGDSGSTLQADLQDLSTIGAGNVVVTPTGVSRTYTITFQGALVAQTVPLLTASASAGSGATVTPVTGANAVQTVTLSGNGTSVFTFEGQTTTNFRIGTDTGSNLQSDLRALSTIGAGNIVVTPTGVSRTYTITFQGTLAGQILPLLTASASSGSSATVTPATTLFAAVAGPQWSILKSLNNGATWTPTDITASNTGIGTTDNIRLTVSGTASAGPVNYVVYAALDVNGNFQRLIRSTDAGTTGTALTALPGGNSELTNIGGQSPQGAINLSLAGDPTNQNVVYIAGTASASGANIWRGTVTATGTVWVSLVTPTVSPHPDSRNLVLSGGSLYEVDDGGIYRLANPNLVAGNPPQWSSLVGNMQDAELVSAAYDTYSGGYVAGAQDNGVSAQYLSNGTRAFFERAGGDGAIVAVDAVTSRTAPNGDPASVRYYSSQNLANFKQGWFSNTGTYLGSVTINFTLNGVTQNTSTPPRSGAFFRFYQPFALNQQNPTLMLVSNRGGSIFQANLPLSLPQGGVANVALQPQQITGLSSNPTTATTTANARTTALAFGAVAYVGMTNPDPNNPNGLLLIKAVATAAPGAVQTVTLSGTGTCRFTFEGQTTTANFRIGIDSGSVLQADLQGLSTIGAGNVVVTPTGVSSTYTITFQGTLAAQTVPALTASASAGSGATVSISPSSYAKATGYRGGTPVAITVDPRDANRAYILDAQGRVWVTLNGGATTPSFTQIGGAGASVFANLPALPANTTLLGSSLSYGAITIIPMGAAAGSGEAVLVSNPPGTTGGGVYITEVPAGTAANPPDFTTISWQSWGTATTTTNSTSGLLPDVQVTSLQYYQQANLVVAATIGRGIWAVTNATSYVGLQAPSVSANDEPAATGSIDQPQDAPIGSAPLPAALQVSAAANDLLTEAVVTLNDRRDGTDEFLSANVAGTNIAAAYDSSTGTLTLTGTDTAADYQQVLQSIHFNDLAPDPSPIPRQLTVQVSDGVTWSDQATITLNVIPNNPAPAIDLDGTDGGDTNAAFTEGQGPVTLAPALTLADPESATLDLATVSILGLQDVGNEFLTADTTGTSISASYNAQTGVLSLFGNDSLANYQQVLRTVAYNNLANLPGPLDRSVAFTLNDGISTSPTAEVELSVQAVNIAPVLTNAGPFALPAAGMSVASLLAGPNGIPIAQDLSGNAISGIAVIGVDNSKGVWQYRTDPDQPWHNMGNPSDVQALLLFNDPDTSIRFVATVPGTVTASLRFRLWDGTGETLALAGLSGGDPDAQGDDGTPQPISAAAVVNTLGGGGSSPFSAGVGVLTATRPSTASQGVFGFFLR